MVSGPCCMIPFLCKVCPDRIELIHKNYRKLVSLLVDVEEWGQVVILNMLTRYHLHNPSF